MDRGNVTSGAAFKTALRGTGLLIVILSVTGCGAFLYMRHHMLRDLQDQILEDSVVLTEIYENADQAAVIDTIDALRQPFDSHLRFFGLFDRAGRPLGGEITVLPPRSGWSELPAPPLLVLRRDLGQMVLVIGRDVTQIRDKERLLILTLGVAGAILCLSFLAIGYQSSRKSLRKLDGIARVLFQVSQGDQQVRLHISKQNDQIDRVAVAINQNLDRLSDLMATTKASAAAIAHDLRTPLSRAFLALDQAELAVEKGAEAQGALEDLGQELSRLRSIFDVILRISRLDQENPPLTQVPLGPLLADLAETFAPLAEENGQSLTLHPVAPDLVLDTDAAMLSQLIANLLQNALNHTPAGTQISFGAEAGHIWLRDTGPGIPAAERDKVFALFYSLDPNRTGGGNGLGLALVQAIADRLGARITLSDADPGLRVDLVFFVKDKTGG